jgi:hypothetical protein
MTFKVLYNGEKYNLPNSMQVLSEYQDDSMKCESIPTLSHLKLIQISTKKKSRFELQTICWRDAYKIRYNNYHLW